MTNFFASESPDGLVTLRDRNRVVDAVPAPVAVMGSADNIIAVMADPAAEQCLDWQIYARRNARTGEPAGGLYAAVHWDYGPADFFGPEINVTWEPVEAVDLEIRKGWPEPGATIDDAEVRQVAWLLKQQFGIEAPRRAAKRAERHRAGGNADGHEVWQRVAAAVKEMLPAEFRDWAPSLAHRPHDDARLMFAELARDPALCRRVAEQANDA